MASIGRYSGNERLDPKTLVEPDPDNEQTKKMWLEEMVKDEHFIADQKKKIESWQKIVGQTMNPSELQVHLTGESHIDCAWLWRFEQTRQKAAITFKHAIEHARMYPGQFNFALSEPLLLDWIKEDDPSLFKEIQETVKSGEIELVGGSYVEPDCMLPSGEAFVRERLYGMRFCNEHFGKMPTVEWFLDSFGYNWGLPQILAKSGAKYFWTTKITWNMYTRFPFVNFWWEGPDGTRILTANFPMGMGPVSRWKKFESGHRPLKSGGKKIWSYKEGYQDLDNHVDSTKIIPHAGCFFGKGDGGHGPTHQEVAEANVWANLGFAKWSKVGTFFDEIAKSGNDLPVWADELYLENHQGCMSGQAEVKRHNRLYENELSMLETQALLTALNYGQYNYPIQDIENMWKVVLRNQFHDVLPGSSIPEVYDDCWDDWMKMDKDLTVMRTTMGDYAVDKSKKLPESSAAILLFNSLSWKRTSRIFIPITVFSTPPKLDTNGKPPYAKLVLEKGSKKIYLCQPIAAEPANTIEAQPAGWYAVVEMNSVSSVPGRLELLSDAEVQAWPVKSLMTGAAMTLSNGAIKLRVDPKTGALLELTAADINGGKNLLTGSKSNLAFGFLDASPQWPAWNLMPKYWRYPLFLSNRKDVQIKISNLGPVFATLEITRTLAKSPVTQKITLFNNCPEVFLEFLTDWKRPMAMLKVLYQTTTNAEEETSDICYAAITRSTRPKSPSDKARWEKICHKYFDLSTPDKKWGLAMLNEGKYAFDASKGDMKLTMLRSPLYPGPSGESWAKSERLENEKKRHHKVPRYGGLGPFKCRYALLPHLGGALISADGQPNVVVKQKADEFNQPIVVIPLRGEISSGTLLIPSGEAAVEVLSPQVFIGAFKYNEWTKNQQLILRCVEGTGLTGQAEVLFHPNLTKKIKNVIAVDLLERPINAKFSWDKVNGKLSWQIGKFEISTFALDL